MSDLEYFTSVELIEELAKRNTFAGIIIRSIEEVKGPYTINKNWDITYVQLTTHQAHDVLQDATEHFKQLAETEENE